MAIRKSVKRTLTVAQAARRLGISRASAYEGVRSGEIPAIRVGIRWLVPKAALHEFLMERLWPHPEMTPHATSSAKSLKGSA